MLAGLGSRDCQASRAHGRDKRASSYRLYDAAVTLIISTLTEQYVALMSDRRITWIQNKKIIRQEDTDTKTFNLFGQFLMGFTGVARIDGWRIERWAMEIFRDVPTSEYFDVLAREITAVFQRNGSSGKVPHAFHAVGYTTFQPGGRVYPLAVTVSNSLDKNGRFSTEALGDTFRQPIKTGRPRNYPSEPSLPA
jgi:hypothetical protein